MGRSTASRKAAASSCSPGTWRGCSTVRFRPGNSTSMPSEPYCRRTRIKTMMAQARLATFLPCCGPGIG